jgi:hypothetical protein
MGLKGYTQRLGFFGWTAAWAVGLVMPTIVHQVFSGLLGGNFWKPWEVLAQFPAWMGMFLPFAAFAGGLTGHAVLSTAEVLKRGLAVALVSYVLLAFASPIVLYLDSRRAGVDVSVVFPFGPNTPRGLLAIRSTVEADPPEAYSFGVEDPLSTPPNWLTYLLHGAVVFAVFSVLSALLGHLAGRLTTGLSPPNRRNARWALGLAGGVAFFIADTIGGEWVRADLSNSGLVGAWLPLVVPLVELGILSLLRSRGEPDQPSSSRPRVG